MKTSKDTGRKRKSKEHRTCPKCATKVPCALLLCECGYHFQTETVVPIDLDLSREGHLFRARSEASLPDYCVWCGRPTSHRVHKTFHWFPAWTYLLLLLSAPALYTQRSPNLEIAARLGALVPPALLLLLFYTRRRSMALDIPLCDTCLLARRKKLRVGTALLFGSIPSAVVVGIVTTNVALTLGIGCLLAGPGLIVFTMNNSLLMPTKIDNVTGFGYFRGASERFLARLPQTNK